jgi:hypothetical protein
MRAIVNAMTTADDLRSTRTRHGSQVLIAGVPWPVYKLAALAVGFLVLVIVGVATMSAAPSVLAAAAAGTVVWLGLGTFYSPRD